VQDGRHHQACFHQAKILSDANAWANAEREISAARPSRLREETFGVESVGLNEPAPVALKREGRDLRQVALANGKRAQLHIVDGAPQKQRVCRRIPEYLMP